MAEKVVLCVTERLSVRRFTELDLTELHDLLSDPKVMKYLEAPYTYEQSEKFLKKVGLAELPLVYAVEDKSRQFIGYVIYHDYDKNSVELGWVLKPSAWGKGYAGELTRGLVETAASRYDYAVIECVPEQEITKTIAAKNGFQYLGTDGGCEIYRRELKEK